MTDKEYWQAIYETAKARDRDNADKFTENPYKRASDADKLKADIDRLNTIVERLDDIQEKEIKQLKAENRQLKTECALLDDELRNARQDTIDVLNKVKERAVGLAAIETYHICNLIDELLKEYE